MDTDPTFNGGEIHSHKKARDAEPFATTPMPSKPMAQSWECSKCTFRHQAPALRCVMCNELRISREQMRDFIQGKTMLAARVQGKNEKEQELSVESHSSDPQNDNPLRNNVQDTAAEPTTSIVRKPFNPYSSKSSTTINPTAAPQHIAPTQEKTVPQPPTQQHRNIASSGSATNGVAHSSPQLTTAPVAKPAFELLALGQKNLNQSKGNGKRPRSAAVIAPKKKADLPYQPGVVPLAEEYADTWIYPSVEAYPKRQYQFKMTRSAIRQNTLVSLPTGLGKTLIAAVVMYNYYRWFPKGKVLFLAPTLPLVDQQVQACYEIMGIPAQDTALLTGKVPAAQRAIIWQEKRVFFCTPQTVQKDLEMSRCEASKVVCVVLDEAHKSTGEYAYCKVISYLEKSGAKFRVLGLSATPGTSIKSVQKVIDVLRINCIEARSDEDPDVKQYIHERQNEVIIVPESVVTKEVERLINDILAPILDVLRNRNILSVDQNASHTSVSSYTLLKSQQYIKGQPPQERDNSALGYLAAGICFLQIRSDLHKHGIGTVRSKLYKLQNERPRGVLSTIVKGQSFQLLWEEVQKVSCNPNAAENTVQDKLQNNPKLIKLREILTQHFERSKASSTSSRVIVFSQFRTSVFEIVNVLNESKPLIRARHFIGQGKGNSGRSTKSDGNANEAPLDVTMEGMKQDEQKNVIKRFKDGVYNTLVCTSIGEEGLDIGEVDLIVNFDCLSSPIRMIQRVGRTGRKREGRVVTLVSEGQEEKTFAKSRQNERTLIHALKNPNSFTVSENNPMLPKDPVVLEQNMLISQNFHMSQVHGVRRKKPDRQPTRDWRLTETEDFQRSCILGNMVKASILSSLHSSNANFPSQLRRLLLRSRAMSSSKNSCRERKVVSHGPMSLLLRSIEASSSSLTSNAVPSGSFRKPSGALVDAGFPVSTNATIPPETTCYASTKPLDYTDTISKSISVPNSPPASVSDAAAIRSLLEEEDIPNQADGTSICRSIPSDPFDSLKPDGGQDCKVSDLLSPTKPLDMIVGIDEFRLPSQCDSLATDGDADCENDLAPVMIDDTFCLPSPTSDNDSFHLPDDDLGGEDSVDLGKSEDLVVEADDEFCLPTPDSSSEGEDDDVVLETKSPQCASLGTGRVGNTMRDPDQLSTAFSMATPVSVNKESECQIPFSESTENFSSLEMAGSKAALSNGDSPHSIPVCVKKISRKRRLVIEDTPDTPITAVGKENCSNLALSDGMLCGAGLENSVCAICFTKEVSEDNPLILCDGLKLGVLCNLVVHCRCYSVKLDVLNFDAEWRCDPCQYLFQGGSPSKIQCSVCHGVDNVLKRSSDNEWKHLDCESVVSKKNPMKRLRKVTFPDAQKHPTAVKRRRPLVDVPPDNQRSPTELALQKKRRRQLVMQQYIDYEAEASDTGDEEEEQDVLAIEEEEMDHDFINDSSQLGFTQDDLDRIEPAVDGFDASVTTHRALDIERERKLQFATPVLNRCMRRNGGNDVEEELLQSSASAPDSVRGLGKMHFIRSVLEHHRNGGSAAELEDFYKEMEQQAENESTPAGDEW